MKPSKELQAMLPPKNHAMTILLPFKLHQLLIRKADLESRKPSSMVRRILEEVLIRGGSGG